MMKPNFMDKLLDGVEVEWKSLEEVFYISAGGDVPKDALSETKTEEFRIPILSNGIGERSLYGWTNKAKIVNPSLTISARGTIGWTSLRDKPFFPIVRLLVLTPKIELNLKYAYHFMKMIENDYISPKTGIPQLTKPMIKDIKIPVPCPGSTEKSLEIQAEIVRVLDTFAEITAEIIAELIDRKRQYTYYLNKLLTFEEGEVEWKKLGGVCTFINGRAYKQSELLEKGKYPVLRVGNFFTNNNWYYSNLELGKDKYCENGDLLYAWSASFGPKLWDGKKSIYHYHIWKVVPEIKIVTKKFLFYLLLWDTVALKSAHGTGSTMMHISKGSIEKRLVPIPSLAEQERIVFVLDKFDILTSSITDGLPREIELRQKQYKYYRNMLLTFQKKEVEI